MNRRERHWIKELPEVRWVPCIPRTIHQTFRTANLPPLLERNVDRLKSSNKDWTYRFYDNADCELLIEQEFGQRILDIYRRISPAYGAARADLFRYLAIYALGGVYLDIKSYFDRSIGESIRPDDNYIISYWDNAQGGSHPGFGLHEELATGANGEIQQWHVIAAPGHPFLRAACAKVLANIETYRPWRFGVGRIGVLRLTGPIAYTQAIEPLLGLYAHRRVTNNAEIGLHYSIGEEYDHTAVFKNHYSTLTSPIATVPTLAKPLTLAYSHWKRRRQQSAVDPGS